jgi:asparagine synthase (glutamine-hydrolysing)
MCGIAGIITGDQDTPSATTLKGMSDRIAHRGPDDSGLYTAPGVGLAHRRLSIIDLSVQGHQPMSNMDGSVWITYNGEIFNFEEIADGLRKKGHEFKSRSDTEVIVHAYEEYGFDCLDKLNGMFAFALWDSRRRRLFAARDRLGVKPFYYHFDGSCLIFGSEIKAILCHPRISTIPNPDAIRQFLLFGHSISDKTWYQGIKQLPPGSYLVLENGNLVVREYWRIRFDVDYERKFECVAEELRAALQSAVRLHLRSDVPVGAHLSGGIDSSSVVALMSRELKISIPTFSAAFSDEGELDERVYSRLVSREFRTQHHEVVPTSDDLPRLLPTLLWHLDEPVIGAAILPMYRVCDLIKRSGIKVVCGGQGADELFGGYRPFFVGAARNLMRSLHGDLPLAPLTEIARLPQYLVRGGAVARRLGRGRKRGKRRSWLRHGEDLHAEMAERWTMASSTDVVSGSFEEMSYMNLKYYLPGLLQQEDRMSMAWSIESRVPFLDYRLVELATRIPSWFKIRRGVLKSVLRESMRGIVPNAILDRRGKMGYPTPSGRWFSGELAGYIRKILVSAPLLCAEVVDRDTVVAMVEDHISGVAGHGDNLWKILNLELWMRGTVDGWPVREARTA